MSLTPEQQQQLNELNKVYAPFAHLANASEEEGEVAIQQMLLEPIPFGSVDRDTLDELAERRQEILRIKGFPVGVEK
jgi:hypothetical protein